MNIYMQTLLPEPHSHTHTPELFASQF